MFGLKSMMKTAKKVGKMGADIAKPIAKTADMAIKYEVTKPRPPKSIKMFEKGLKCYNNGDYSGAYSYYQKSGDLGNPSGYYNMAIMHRDGVGVEKSESKALVMFRKAADLKDSEAAFATAYRYYNGIGTSQSLENAFYYYLLSAQLGNPKGQVMAGVF